MLRLACCLATERGISVCAPVHDAMLIEAPVRYLEDVVAEAQKAMADASAGVLDGFRLRSDAKIFRYPDRYVDQRGTRMWAEVWAIIRESIHQREVGPPQGVVVQPCNIKCAPEHTRSILSSLSYSGGLR